jgi:hypothetical protein
LRNLRANVANPVRLTDIVNPRPAEARQEA